MIAGYLLLGDNEVENTVDVDEEESKNVCYS